MKGIVLYSQNIFNSKSTQLHFIANQLYRQKKAKGQNVLNTVIKQI